MRLVEGVRQIGATHRHGWPMIVSALRDLETTSDLLIDDFVERTFDGQDKSGPWLEPWVGFFHHPPNMPGWYAPQQTLERVLSTPYFMMSQPFLVGAIATSEYLAEWLRTRLDIPVQTILHPTDLNVPQFDFDAWQADKKLVQVGWYLRNYRAIYQVDALEFRKIHLKHYSPWIQNAERKTDTYSITGTRKDVGYTEVVSRLENEEYDKMLTSSVVFLELFDTSANNAVVECIARTTPILINRHPAVEEYLGVDYPMYYESFDDLADAFKRHHTFIVPNVKRTHEYLKDLNKTRFSMDFYLQEVRSFVESLDAA